MLLHPWQFGSPAITDDHSCFLVAEASCCCNAAVVYDMNGREAKDVEPVLAAVGDVEQYIFCSSAGVYLKSDQMPHREEDSTDPKSRHKVNTHKFSHQRAKLDYKEFGVLLVSTQLMPLSMDLHYCSHFLLVVTC